MTFVRTIVSIAVLSTATLAASAGAASDDAHDSHHPAQTAGIQIAQATPVNPAMGPGAGAAMPGYAEQMKAMRDMHDRVMAAKTLEERNLLMAEQMKLMQNGMTMMGGMGPGAMMGGKPGDTAASQRMMEQRMDMMQSMMQMMMDRMQSVPATK